MKTQQEWDELFDSMDREYALKEEKLALLKEMKSDEEKLLNDFESYKYAVELNIRSLKSGKSETKLAMEDLVKVSEEIRDTYKILNYEQDQIIVRAKGRFKSKKEKNYQ